MNAYKDNQKPIEIIKNTQARMSISGSRASLKGGKADNSDMVSTNGRNSQFKDRSSSRIH